MRRTNVKDGTSLITKAESADKGEHRHYGAYVPL